MAHLEVGRSNRVKYFHQEKGRPTEFQWVNAMGELAGTYLKHGRCKEAELLAREVVVAQKGLLGNDHVDTLSAMTNLAQVYSSQGWGQGRSRFNWRCWRRGRGY